MVFYERESSLLLIRGGDRDVDVVFRVFGRRGCGLGDAADADALLVSFLRMNSNDKTWEKNFAS